MRLRGQVSQGIVCRPTKLAARDLAAEHEAGTDFADDLGVTKWVPQVPIHLSGDVVCAPDLLRWIEIENVKRYPDVFGEVFGAGVQDLKYGETARGDRPGYAVFDIALDVDGRRVWPDAADLREAWSSDRPANGSPKCWWGGRSPSSSPTPT